MDAEQRVKECLDKIKKDNKRINAILEINPNALEEARAIDAKKKKGRLYGKVIAVKSNINVKGLTCSCASKVLEDYVASYDATVIERIKAEDGVIIGMANCDEFASGFSGEFSAFGPTENPRVPGFVAGGSSSGSAAAVAAGFCDMTLGSDTGGSIRVPASFCGVVGIKPSYGCVSRYGLIDLSMSLDQIGTIANNVEDAALLLDVIKGYDERDSTSFDSEKIILKTPKELSIGYIQTPWKEGKKVFHFHDHFGSIESREWSEDSGAFGITESWHPPTLAESTSFPDIKLNYIDLAVQTYHPIVWTEFFSATRRFDGRRYGKKIEDAAGPEVLRRIYGGAEISKAELEGRYYHKALEIRELIKKEFEKAFKEVDCIIMPTVSVLPWKIGEKKTIQELYEVDALAIPANLAGVCSVSVPIGEIEGKPIGVQVICAKGQESKMLSVAREIEKSVNKQL